MPVSRFIMIADRSAVFEVAMQMCNEARELKVLQAAISQHAPENPRKKNPKKQNSI